jgi:hypothetical protein
MRKTILLHNPKLPAGDIKLRQADEDVWRGQNRLLRYAVNDINQGRLKREVLCGKAAKHLSSNQSESLSLRTK